LTEHDEPFWGEPRTGDFQKVDNAASAPLGVHCSESVGGITLTSMHSDAQKKRNFLSSNSQIAIARRRWSTCDAGRMRLPQRSSTPCASAKHGSGKAPGSGALRRYSPSKFGDPGGCRGGCAPRSVIYFRVRSNNNNSRWDVIKATVQSMGYGEELQYAQPVRC